MESFGSDVFLQLSEIHTWFYIGYLERGDKNKGREDKGGKSYNEY
jgi:hypothetical protein